MSDEVYAMRHTPWHYTMPEKPNPPLGHQNNQLVDRGSTNQPTPWRYTLRVREA